MDIKVRIAVFIISFLWLLLILRSVKRRRLWERYAIFWVCLAFGILFVPLLVDIFDYVVYEVGVEHPPSFFFLVAILGILLILFQSSVEITTVARQSRDAVQDLAILEERVQRLEKAGGKETQTSPQEKGASPAK